MINYELLKTFVVIGKAGTFAGAAKSLYITVSAVSQQMRALEAQLGVPLFERFGRRVQLTTTGKQLLGTLNHSFFHIDTAIKLLKTEHQTVQGLVTIGAPRTFGRYWLHSRLLELFRRHSELQICVRFDIPSIMERELQDGKLDFAILVREPYLPSLEVTCIASESFFAVASLQYIEQWGAPTTVEEFCNHRFLCFDEDLAMHAPWWIESFGSKAPRATNFLCAIASLDEMLSLAIDGVAIAVLPDYVITAAVDNGQLVILQPKAQDQIRRTIQRPIFLGWRRGAIPSARFMAVKEALIRIGNS